MQIEQINISELTAYDKNSRKHSDEQIHKIAASIKEFGFTNPVLIQDDGTVIAGHGRVEAAKVLKMAEVPVIRLTHLTPEQARAYVIADNALTDMSEWDVDLLRFELLELKNLHFDLELLGLDDVAGILAEIEPLAEMPGLPEGDRQPFQQMTFTVHDSQKEVIDAALKKAKQRGLTATVNQNSNGNALFALAEAFVS